jgi:hypothetical protein
VACDVGTLLPFVDSVIRVRFDVSSVGAGAVASIASVHSRQDPDDSNNSKVAITAVGPPVGTHTNLAVTIDDHGDPVISGRIGQANSAFTIVVRNTGLEPAASVRVQLDTLMSVFDAGCFVFRRGRLPVCDLGDIPAGGSATITVSGGYLAGVHLTTVSVTSGAIEPDYRDNVDREVTTVVPGFR